MAGRLSQPRVVEVRACLALSQSISHSGHRLAGIPADPQAVFIAGAVLATVIDWLRRDLPGTAAQMAAVIRPSLASVAATALPEPPAADQLAADELAARKLA